jgi:hypothetical protein
MMGNAWATFAAVDGLRGLLGCHGHVCRSPRRSTIARSPPTAGPRAGSSGKSIADRPAAGPSAGSGSIPGPDPPEVAGDPVARCDRDRARQLLHSLLPIFLVEGCREAIAAVDGPVIYIANLLTEGRGMSDSRPGTRSAALGRDRPSVDAVVLNVVPPPADVLDRYAREDKVPLPRDDPGGMPDD